MAKVGNAADLLRHVSLTRPEVAIVDIKAPPTNTDEGVAAAQEIRSSHPETGVLLLSHYSESRYAARLIEQHPEGVGYLLKDRMSDVALLTDALARLCDGECVIDPTTVSRLLAGARQPSPLVELTERERDVLAPIAEGRSNEGHLRPPLPQPQDRRRARQAHLPEARHRRVRRRPQTRLGGDCLPSRRT